MEVGEVSSSSNGITWGCAGFGDDGGEGVEEEEKCDLMWAAVASALDCVRAVIMRVEGPRVAMSRAVARPRPPEAAMMRIVWLGKVRVGGGGGGWKRGRRVRG